MRKPISTSSVIIKIMSGILHRILIDPGGFPRNNRNLRLENKMYGVIFTTLASLR